MNIRPKVAIWLLAGAACLSCDGEPAGFPEALGPLDEYPLAFHHQDCAPWDGPALALYFVRQPMTAPWTAPGPHLRVSIYAARPGLIGQTVQWESTDANDGYAARCLEEGACEPATLAKVRLREWQADEGWLTGDVELSFEDGSRVAGTFRALGLQSEAICG